MNERRRPANVWNRSMNNNPSRRSIPWLRRLAAPLAFAAIASSSSVSSAAEPQAGGGTAAEFTRIEEILRQAGASSSEVARFEEGLRQASPADLGQFADYLQQQSPTARNEFVEDLRINAQYSAGPDSKTQPGVPHGKTFDFIFEHSKIFPGTARKITVYVPAEYTADKAACVYVGLDDLGFAAPIVFDNLIYKHEMPVTIAIGIAPGAVDSDDPPNDPRFNRSFEFDSLNDNFGRFVLNEVLPEVERHQTPDGLPIRLSKDPNDRATGGGSTGGIGAFTLAWEHPDAFRRVFTAVGTFVGMRGGDHYAVLVRKTEPKPIRIYMQDGSHDELATFLGEVGSWWMSNQTMERALKFAGYQVEHVWGEGSHNGNHGTMVFPEAMRWLWKDWPRTITSGESQNVFLKAILQPSESWQSVPGDYQSDGVLAADTDGGIVFHDSTGGKTRKLLADGRIGAYAELGKTYAALAFGPDGRVYVSQADRIVAYTHAGRFSRTVAQGIRGQQLVVTHDNKLYFTETGTGNNAGKVWLIQSDGRKTLLDTGLNYPSGIALSPDGLWLAVAESKTHWGYNYRVKPDGSGEYKQRFYWFHVPDTADDSGAGSWVMDREGRLYAATRMGVQVFDRNGRSRAILPLPGGEVTALAFGGSNFDTLYVSCTDHKLYRRKLKVPGAQPWAAPIKLPAWSAG
jgi:gluconolactonase